jgi:integrase
MPPTRDDVGRAITLEEETALLQACSQSRSRSLVPFVTPAIETGARYGTIRTLEWGNVDFENRCLKWGKDKTAAGTGRVVPLSQKAMAALSFWATHFPKRKPEHYVFPAERYPYQFSWRCLWRGRFKSALLSQRLKAATRHPQLGCCR